MRKNAVARVNQNNGEIGGGGSCCHVARVLNVSGCIGDDELAFRSGKIPVRDVDGDALLPFAAKAIGQEGQIQLAPLCD